jgi:hypothetical protein
MKVQEKSYQSAYCTGKINFCVAGNKNFLLGGHKIYCFGDICVGGGGQRAYSFVNRKK